MLLINVGVSLGLGSGVAVSVFVGINGFSSVSVLCGKSVEVINGTFGDGITSIWCGVAEQAEIRRIMQQINIGICADYNSGRVK